LSAKSTNYTYTIIHYTAQHNGALQARYRRPVSLSVCLSVNKVVYY